MTASVPASRAVGIRTVGLSGGVFCNALLTRRLTELLEARGLRVLRQRIVPPNDGGISLGQAAVGSAMYERSDSLGKAVAPCAWPCPQNS